MEKPRQLIVPCIHLNGTSKTDLESHLERAHDLIDEAYDALRKTAPNGRDYYVYDGNAHGLAGEQHSNRLNRLESVRKELDAILGGMIDGKKFVEVE